MAKHPADTCVALDSFKDAALYFSHVIPLFQHIVREAIVEGLTDFGDDESARAELNTPLNEALTRCIKRATARRFAEEFSCDVDNAFDVVGNMLLPSQLKDSEKFQKDWQSSTVDSLLAVPVDLIAKAGIETRACASGYSVPVSGSVLRDSYRRFILDFSLHELPCLTKQKAADSEIPSGDNFVVALTNADLIDTSNVSWDKIRKFREDTESRIKLASLRCFFTDEYESKDVDYIKDDLYVRLEKYADVVEKWGFETRAMAFEAILKSKTLRGTICGSLFSSLANPAMGIAMLIGGASIEGGKVALLLSKRKAELDEFVKQFPLAYIIDAKEKLESKDTD